VDPKVIFLMIVFFKSCWTGKSISKNWQEGLKDERGKLVGKCAGSPKTQEGLKDKHKRRVSTEVRF
jgi:hypothetical protein